MTSPPLLDPYSSLWQLIAIQVRRHREQYRQSGATLGEMLDVDRSTVSRIENGHLRLQRKHAKVLDRKWQTDGLFDGLVYLALTGHSSEWLKAHFGLETRASELHIWELAWIPGLLQTEAYARAIFTAYGLEDVDKLVETRMARQAALTRKPAPLIWACLDQSVIDQPVGGPEVMREQLARLLELARLPHVAIRIMPRSVGAHEGRDGSFKIMTVRGTEYIYTEASEGGRLTADDTDVRLFRTKFTRIGNHALPVEASLRLIQETMERLE